MSEEFDIDSNIKPRVADVVAEVSRADLVVRGEDFAGGVEFFYNELSTRTVLVSYTEPTVSVRINSLSCEDDCFLALKVVESIVKLCGGTIHHEHMGDVARENLMQTFDDSWAKHSAESGARVVATLIDQGRGPIAIPGPVRNTYVGARILKEFRDTPNVPLHESFLNLMRKVQYIADESKNPAIFVTKDVEPQLRFVVWFGDAVIMPPGNFVLLDERGKSNEEADIIKVSFADFRALLGDDIQMLDEEQIVTQEYTPLMWQELRKRAKSISTA